MRIFVLTALLLATSAMPVLAQDGNLALCKLRSQHVAAPNTAYQAGVDAQGRAVVPADVAASPSVVPDVVRIPMTVDLAQRLGSVPAGAEMKTSTGMIEIHKDGRVSFNGQDMTEVAVVLCDGKVPTTTTATAPAAATAQETATVAPAAPVVPKIPNVPVTPQATVDKVVVPVDAPSLPMATVPVSPDAQQPVVSSITTDHKPAVIPANAMTTKALPPQTLGQFIVPAKKAPEVLQPAIQPTVQPVVNAPVVEPAQQVRPPLAAPADQKMGERTNQDLEKEDGIIWGQGN